MPSRSTGKTTARQEVSAGGVVFRRRGEAVDVLLIKAGGRWSFPKGNVERGESHETAALREIAEETGLPLSRLRTINRLPAVEYAFRWGGALIFKRVHYYLVELTRDAPLEPQFSEIEEVRWLTPGAARRTISFKNARGTLEAAIAALERLELAS